MKASLVLRGSKHGTVMIFLFKEFFLEQFKLKFFFSKCVFSLEDFLLRLYSY